MGRIRLDKFYQKPQRGLAGHRGWPHDRKDRTMSDQYYKVRVQLPSGRTFDREVNNVSADAAARVAIWTQYMDNQTYNPDGSARWDRLPDGWGALSEAEKVAIATQAGYRAVAVASYADGLLVWQEV